VAGFASTGVVVELKAILPRCGSAFIFESEKVIHTGLRVKHTALELPFDRAITQRELASFAGLHVNSILYLERQDRITTGYSRERVEQVDAPAWSCVLPASITGGEAPSKGTSLGELSLRANFYSVKTGLHLSAGVNFRRPCEGHT